MSKLNKICNRIKEGCILEDDPSFRYYESGVVDLGDIKVNIKIERLNQNE